MTCAKGMQKGGDRRKAYTIRSSDIRLWIEPLDYSEDEFLCSLQMSDARSVTSLASHDTLESRDIRRKAYLLSTPLRNNGVDKAAIIYSTVV